MTVPPTGGVVTIVAATEAACCLPEPLPGLPNWKTMKDQYSIQIGGGASLDNPSKTIMYPLLLQHSYGKWMEMAILDDYIIIYNYDLPFKQCYFPKLR